MEGDRQAAEVLERLVLMLAMPATVVVVEESVQHGYAAVSQVPSQDNELVLVVLEVLEVVVVGHPRSQELILRVLDLLAMAEGLELSGFSKSSSPWRKTQVCFHTHAHNQS